MTRDQYLSLVREWRIRIDIWSLYATCNGCAVIYLDAEEYLKDQGYVPSHIKENVTRSFGSYKIGEMVKIGTQTPNAILAGPKLSKQP